MRLRDEIEQDCAFSGASYDKSVDNRTALIIELLLDIRDLLNKNENKMSDMQE